MTVGELIAKLSQLPPSTVVVTDDNEVSPSEATAYQYQARVKRHGRWIDVSDPMRGEAAETVVLITMFAHDDKEEL